MELANKTALITGGRQGIGRAIADLFLAQGAKVAVCGRGTRPDDLPADMAWYQVDVSQSSQVNSMVAHIRKHFGWLNILVNNAGVQIEKAIAKTTDDDWQTLMGTNGQGVFNCIRACLPVMNQGGSIINIGSISGNTADPGLALYNASKAFVHGLTRSVAVDHGPHIRCNAICPGWIMTDMADSAFAVANNPATAKQDALGRHPAGRFGEPADIANMALWLAGDASAFATGQLFTIDGGLTAASPLNPSLF